MKKVILLLIDSLMSKDLENAIKTRKTRALKFLVNKGVFYKECVTAFPTMTASVDATLMTGVYPDKHKIPGLIWYKSDEKRIVDYVNGTKTVLKLGINQTAKDVLFNLNNKHLNVSTTTIFEDIAKAGKTSGSINFIIHRGAKSHHLKPPLLLNLVTNFSLKNKEIKGPDYLSLGAMHKPVLRGRKIPWSWKETIFARFGINDSFAIDVAKNIIQSGEQPDFMAVYLPEHDHYLHKNLDQPLPSIEQVDNKVAALLDSYDSWEKALEKNVFIIIGDHGQTKIGEDESYNIDLDKLLQEFNMVQIGKKATKENELVIANNERMAYVYPLKSNKEQAIIQTLLREDRIDFVAWKEDDKGVATSSDGSRIVFSKNGKFIDPYGIYWSVDGDLEVLDIVIEGTQIHFNRFPDGLSRLYASLFSQDIPSIVISAKEGFEFISKSFPTHLGGGSHGSLHKIDSLVPLVIAGTSKTPEKTLRIVDLKDYILQLLNAT